MIKKLVIILILTGAVACTAKLQRNFAGVSLATTFEKLEFIIEGLSIEADSAAPKIEIAYAAQCDLKFLGEWEAEFHFFKNQLFKIRFQDDGDLAALENVYRKVKIRWEGYRAKKTDSEIVWSDESTRISLSCDLANKELTLEVSDINLAASAARYRRVQDEEPYSVD